MTTAELYDLRDADTAVAAYRADLVTRYFAAEDPFEQLRLFAEAVRYDRRHPDWPSLADELYGTSAGEVA